MDNSVSSQIIKLLQIDHFLSAPELVEKLHAQGRAVNKTSVYRALDKLLDDGRICKQNLKDNELVYELRQDHHDHLVCTNCGQVIPIECHVGTETIPADFVIDHHHLTIFGICGDCASKNPGLVVTKQPL